MRAFEIFPILFVLSLFVIGFSQNVPGVDVHLDQIPESKLGEMFHKAAAKVDGLLGDEAGKQKHELLVKEKQIKEKVMEVLHDLEKPHKNAAEKVNEWKEVTKDKVTESNEGTLRKRVENMKEQATEQGNAGEVLDERIFVI
jgi:hypothetical protein